MVVDALPSSVEAEQALIGSVLMDNAAFSDLPTPVPSTAFFDPVNARLWGVISELIGRDAHAEPLDIMRRMESDPGLKELGGIRYLADILDHAPPPSTAPHFAGMISDTALRRELIRVCTDTIGRAKADTEASAFDVLAGLESAAASVAHGQSQSSAWVSAGSITAAALSEARERKGAIGVSTGLHELDEAVGGLRRGQMIIVAGRPAMGKSSAGLQIAKAVSRKGRGVLFFSLEMPDFDLGLRMACDVAHDPLAVRYAGQSGNPRYFDAARGRLSEEQWWRLDQAREDIARWPLDFDTRPGLTVSTMMALARRRLRAWERNGIEPGCLVVDHLTIAKPEGQRGGNKVAEIGDISRGLAEMAKHLDIPVVALCQLSRDVEKRGTNDKRPTLADLRWSGEIEQDARVVAFLYRPEYYCRPPEDSNDPGAALEHQEKLAKVRHKLFWIVEKNNNGPTGQVETYCDVACSAIRDKLGTHQ